MQTVALPRRLPGCCSLAAAWFLAVYMQRVYDGRPGPIGRVIGPLERLVYRVMRIDPEREMRWTEYARGVLLFSAVSVLAFSSSCSVSRRGCR